MCCEFRYLKENFMWLLSSNVIVVRWSPSKLLSTVILFRMAVFMCMVTRAWRFLKAPRPMRRSLGEYILIRVFRMIVLIYLLYTKPSIIAIF